MELQDIKGINAILDQTKIYGVISEQLADNLEDFKKQILKQKADGSYDDILSLLSDAESLIYQASSKLAEIEESHI
ncbi:MAG: hypothetical protein MSE70_10530 [Streptococcus sp.]|uniref:hypothetical protein n=1 Tax=Streptococcus sp. TaxID=1306 RepID=UPI00199D6BC8|nr:hypothetical protein [Streptococcus sp.]MBC9708602.1 hypothetical protein [Enterococcus sp.]MCI7517451.1 hypothetical protein [Streptococcus sp.]